MKEMKRILSLVLCFVMVVGLLPMSAFATDGISIVVDNELPSDGRAENDVVIEDGMVTEMTDILATNTDTDYLFFATDRHTDTSIIGTLINKMEESIGEDQLEYLGLGGDMVGSGSSHPAYNSSTVLSEITGATTSLSAANVDIVAGIHDMNVNDDKGIVLPYSGGGAQIYEGDSYYVYGVPESCISGAVSGVDPSTEANDFVTWANGSDIDKSKVIIVLSHYPLHVKRSDNIGAYYWHEALNTVAGATTAEDGTITVARNIVFFHGHNHTTDRTEYVYEVGDTMAIQAESSTKSETIYYTYATAGYLSQERGNGQATLMAITDDTITMTKYGTSGAVSNMATVTRVVQEETKTVTSIEVSGTTSYYVGDELDLTVTATYSDGTTKDVTADAELTGYDLSTAGTQTVTATYEGKTATTSITVTAVQINSIAVTTQPTKVTYVIGEALDTTGMVVTATYNNGTTAEVTGWYTSTVDMTTAGTKEVTVNYVVDSITYKTTFTITVEEGVAEGVTLTGIEITSEPTKTEYLISQELDLDGMVVVATFSDGSTVELQYKPFSTSTIYGGYELDNFSMYVKKNHEMVVTYTFGEVTRTASTTINVWNEDFTDENTGVKVHVADEDYGVTAVNVTESTNTNVESAIGNYISTDNYKAYDITLTLDTDGNYALTNDNKTVTLPIPENVTNPVVCYVSDDGLTVDQMDITNNGDGTVSFETNHFSIYVIGDSAEDPEKDLTLGSDETKTVYVLVDTPTAGNQYIIVSSGTADGGYALKENSTTGTSVTINAASGSLTAPYIETSDETIMWNATSGLNFQSVNGGYYLNYSESGNSYSVSFSTSSASDWTAGTNQLYRNGKKNDYYLRCNGSTWAMGSSNSTYNVYFYEKQTVTISSKVKYEVSAENIEHIYSAIGATDETEALTYELLANGTATNFTGEVWTVKVVSDPSGIIDTENSTNETLYFTGATGTATMRVYYELDGNGDGDVGDEADYKVWTTFTVTASNPYYSINLHKANISFVEADITAFAEGVTYYTYDSTTETYVEVAADAEFDSTATYYTVSATVGDEITDVVTRKNVKAGDTYSVWAVIKEHNAEYPDGEPLGDVEDSRIYWTVSDESIATIDPHTGVITFTGTNYGTITVTAHYLDENGDILCSDAVTISVSATSATVPNDGTDDFPEYPNEGAVRHDKTATAVGNFSETGIAKVELSMTGVPYTTGSEIDVVLMLDMTGSMSANGMAAAVAAAKAFVTMIVQNTDKTYNKNRVAVYQFNSSGIGTYFDLQMISSDAELETALGKIVASQSSGGTPFDEAAQKCYDVLQAAKKDGTGNDRQQFCVFMSDGGPTAYYGSDEKTYYNSTGNNSSGDVAIENYLTGYTSSDSADWEFTLPTEYYTDAMKADDVTVYTVGLLLQNVPSSPKPYSSMTSSTYDSETDSLTTIGSHYYFTSEILKQMASDESKYIDIFNVDNASKATAAFKSIAKDILAAATDVTVADKIGSDYTMVFDAPNAVVDAADGGQEYYIEVTDYALVPVYADDGETITDYTRGTATSLLKLYFGYNETTGYYAATDAAGTAATTPVFEKVALGDKGTKFYWTTDSSLADADAISVVGVDSVTYYFYSAGMSNTAEDFDSTEWYNMTSGAYASGTNTTVTLTDEDGNATTSATCQNMIIATPYFVYNAATKMLIWTIEEISSSEMTLTYFLYLNNSGGFSGTEQEIEPKTYETNQFAYVNYTNFNGNECQLDFPVPQMTWNGAQVSYVFYLVNEAGQPVNRAGRVVPFSEAVYVTDVYTYAIIWNDLEQSAGLDADRLAAELVPEVYELYDTDAAYSIHVYEDTKKSNLNNHFVISGNVTDADYSVAKGYTNAKTTYVFNTKADANKYNIVGAYVADDGDNTENEIGLTYWCKDYNVTGTYTTEEKTDELYGTYYTYTVTSATYSGTEVQVAYDDLDSKTGASEIDGYVYYVDDEGKIYTIVAKTDGNEVEAGFDFSNTTVAFAVVWKPELVEDTVVVDYGLDVVINVTTNDALASGVVGVRADAPENVEINKGIYTSGKVTSVEVMLNGVKIGTASVENLNAVRFSLDKDNGMQFSEPATFYYESDVNYYKDNVLQTPSMYSSVTVIPATTVYYEDDFVVFESYTKSGDTWPTEADEENKWATPAQSGTQQQDRPGASKISEALDADNNYGYDEAYAEMSQHSMRSAQITVNADTRGEATFTFYGTGFDVVSVTSGATGTFIVQVFGGSEATGTAIKTYMVDTFYGMDHEGNVVDTNDPSTLYQVPVMKIFGLTYGQYTVKIIAGYNEVLDHADAGSYTLYLDAIRIYDPTGNQNETANKAYTADGEGFPLYKMLRDMVISAGSFGSQDVCGGLVFIDGANETNSIADYTSYGPNNELYLMPGQSVAFTINKNAFATEGEIADIQLAVKTVGGSGKLELFNPSVVTTTNTAEDGTITSTNTVIKNKLQSLEIGSATDMYYSIKSLSEAVIVLSNPSDGTAIVSITNLKFTFTATATIVKESNNDDTSGTSEASVLTISASDATMAVRALNGDVTTLVLTPSTHPDNPAKPTKPTKPAAPVETIKPVKPGVPVEPIKPVKPVVPVEPIKPVKPVDKYKPTKFDRPVLQIVTTKSVPLVKSGHTALCLEENAAKSNGLTRLYV